MGFLPVIGLFEGLFLIALILSKRDKGISDFILSGIFLIFSIYLCLLYFELYNRQNGYPYPFFIHSSVPIIFLHGPSIWFYTRSLTDQNFKLQLKYLLHLIPFLAYFVYIYYEVYSLSGEQRIIMDSTEAFKKNILYPVTIAGIAISTQGYYIAALISIKQFNRQIRSYFSKVENIDLKWLKFFMLTTIVCFASISTLYIFDATFGIVSYNSQELFVFILGTIYILVLGFYGHQQGNIFSSNAITIDLDKTANPKPAKKTDNAPNTFIDFLLEYMNSKKPYLDPEINIAKLNNELNVTPEYLSNIINNKLNRNFFDFINYYRTEEFKEKCKNPENKNLTIIAIAYDCGFNSKATFNRVFKRATGYTPSQYLLEVSE